MHASLRTGLLLCSLTCLACSANDTATEPSEPSSDDPYDDVTWDDPCDGVTCSDNRNCVVTGGLASCVCEDGFLATQYDCLACTPLNEDHVYDLDVPTVTAQFRVTLAGEPVTYATNGFSTYLFADGEYQASLPDLGTIEVIPGTYDFAYTNLGSPGELASVLPFHFDKIFATNVVIDGTSEIVVDVPIAWLTAALLVNGQYNASWSATLVDSATGYSSEFSFDGYAASIPAIQGIYDILYFGGLDGTAPENQGAILAKNIDELNQTVFELEMIHQQGSLTVGGQVFQPPPQPGAARVSLFSAELGIVYLGDLMETSEYDSRLIPGTYDVLYEAGDPIDINNDERPTNKHAIIPAGLVISTDHGTTDIDIPVVHRTGVVKLGGIPWAGSWETSLGYMNQTTGDHVSVFPSAGSVYTVNLIPGVYDLYYAHSLEPWDDVLEPGEPANGAIVVATGIVIDESGIFDIDIPVITVTGSLTVNGEVSQAGSLQFLLRRPWSDGFFVGDFSNGNYSVDLILGTYDVGFYDNFRWFTVLRDVALTESRSLDIDVPIVDVTGRLTLDGAAVPGGTIDLFDVDGRRVGRLADTSGKYSTPLVPGTYAITYSGGFGYSTALPNNLHKVLDCIVIE